MSNPGLIKLVSIFKKKGHLNRLEVEDNIGESIHLHLNNIRIDFSVSEFLEFSNKCKDIHNEYLKKRNIDGLKLDSSFVFKISEHLNKIRKIENKKIRLKELQVIHIHESRIFGSLYFIRSIKNSLIYKYLTKSSDKYLSYKQDNFIGMTNYERLRELKNNIELFGFKGKEKPIIIFNNQPYIRDGQHRACTLAALYGFDMLVDVQVIYFEDGVNSLNPYYDNLRQILISNIKRLFRLILKKFI